jgi:hypothetical protein
MDGGAALALHRRFVSVACMLSIHLLVAQLAATIVVSRTPEARDCPDTEQFAARLGRITGSEPSSNESATAVVRADFSRAGATYEAKVRLTGSRDGERVLRDESPTCEALADAVAVATALLLDPASRPPATRAAEKTEPPLALWLWGRFGGGAGFVGGTTWMAGAGLEASLGRVTFVELGAGLSGTRENRFGDGAVEVGLWFIEVGAFRSLTGETFKLGPSLQLMAGALRGAGTEYPVRSSASLAWFAAGVGLRADVNVGSGLRIGARSVVVVPARKQSFYVEHLGTAHDSAAVAGVADLVLDVRLW